MLLCKPEGNGEVRAELDLKFGGFNHCLGLVIAGDGVFGGHQQQDSAGQ